MLLQAPADKADMYLDFFLEVVRRTAQLVAAWQCVGFCHGEPLIWLVHPHRLWDGDSPGAEL